MTTDAKLYAGMTREVLKSIYADVAVDALCDEIDEELAHLQHRCEAVSLSRETGWSWAHDFGLEILDRRAALKALKGHG